jgi:hypothetical protein
MTPNRLTAMSIRWAVFTLAALWLSAPNVQAQSPAATAINGVYEGTYTCAQGPRTLKLTLQVGVNGSLTGIFTFYLPPISHARAFSYSLNGTYEAGSGRFTLNPIKWETTPPAGYSMVGMEGVFDSSSAKVTGRITTAMCGAFQASRSHAEPANTVSTLAPQQAPPTAQTLPQTAPPTGQPSATSMTGVYSGTYSCNSGTAKLKVSLIGAPDNTITGFFIIDLPDDGGRFTYKLGGRYAWGAHQFLLNAVEWGPPTPPAYSMARLSGKYYPGSDMLAGSVASSFCGDFHSTRDKSESPESIAATLQTPPAAKPVQAQAPAASSAADLKSQLPPPAPPNGLVRKSRAYWDTYQSDLIRQIFDGGFGTDIASVREFQFFFTTYVEMFSKDCRAYLPPQHVTIEVTQNLEKTDRYGHTTTEQMGQTGSVEVDSRFAPSYREFGESVTSSSNALAGALAVASGRTTVDEVLNPAANRDLDRFFAKESCRSAAMHQLGENLLRAATGKRTLQEVGATIPGAAAETDKSLPPGRYARFVDGCNAYYRDPANSRFSMSGSGSYCRCLGEQYQHVMTRDEESLYANDFDRRFNKDIAQPRSVSTNPSWPRLHPAADRCLR